jgi:hypothetical protein
VRWKGTEMEPAQVFVALIGWALIVTAGYHVGKYKGRETAGLILTILLGLVGLVILACLPKTEAVKAAEAQRQLPYPPQYPYPPYQYPPQTQYPPQYPPQTQYPPQYPPPGPYPPPQPAPWDPPPS